MTDYQSLPPVTDTPMIMSLSLASGVASAAAPIATAKPNKRTAVRVKSSHESHVDFGKGAVLSSAAICLLLRAISRERQSERPPTRAPFPQTSSRTPDGDVIRGSTYRAGVMFRATIAVSQAPPAARSGCAAGPRCTPARASILLPGSSWRAAFPNSSAQRLFLQKDLRKRESFDKEWRRGRRSNPGAGT